MPVTINGTTGVVSPDGSAGTPAYQGSDANTGMFFPAADTIAFAEGGAEVARFDSSGNLGIGTSSPAYNLDIARNSNKTSIQVDSGNNGIIFTDSGGTRYTIGSSIGVSAPGNYLAFNYYSGSAWSERARIDSSGNLLVGKTGANDNTNGFAVYNIGASPAGALSVAASTSDNSSSGFRQYSTGAGAYRFYVGYGGTINATSTSISGISDQSLKENIRDLETGLAQVMALKPRRFDWKEETKIGEKNVAGFVAQEVEQVLPELVYDYQYSENVTKKSLKMGDILPTLVKAIQEQQTLITSLTARIAALEGAAQ